MTKTKLFDLCDPFARAANIIDGAGTATDNTPLRDVLPGIWPTVGDLRRLRDEMVAKGWKNTYERQRS